MTALTNRKQNLLDVLTICLLTLVISALLILACKASPVEAASLFVKGIFGTKASFAEIFVKACPLILTGLGCAVAFRTGFFNIGAEGQFYVPWACLRYPAWCVSSCAWWSPLCAAAFGR